MKLTRLHLIHWKAEEAEERAAWLRARGYQVSCEPFNPAALRQLKLDAPDALLIDLGRLPSQGRDAAIQLRQHKPLQQALLVFVGGQPDKLERLRQLLPEALYTTWETITDDLPLRLATPPVQVTIPESSFAAYARVPLVQKLGIQAHMEVVLLEAPSGFSDGLGALPPGVRFMDHLDQTADLIIWFVCWQADLQSGLAAIQARLGRGGLWIAWPKQASGVKTDLNQALVRQAGLAAGLVDYKISAFDATWSGLRFAVRKKPGPSSMRVGGDA